MISANLKVSVFIGEECRGYFHARASTEFLRYMQDEWQEMVRAREYVRHTAEELQHETLQV